MTRRNASGTVLLTVGLMAAALGAAPSDACAQFGGNYFPNELYSGFIGDFLVPDGFGNGYDYGGPLDDGLTWSPWGDDEEEDVDGEALFDLFYGPWDDPDDPDTYDGDDDGGDEDDPWDGDPDYDGPRDGGRASEERAARGQTLSYSRTRDAEEPAHILAPFGRSGR